MRIPEAELLAVGGALADEALLCPGPFDGNVTGG